MKLRIKETVTLSDEKVFYPQYKLWFLWMNFWDLTEFPPKCVRFYNLTTAKNYIIHQKNKPKDKIYYL